MGYDGDDQPAVSASIASPKFISISTRGSIYFSDRSNHRVRMIGTDGFIHTVVGTGFPLYSGDGFLASKSQLFNPVGVSVSSNGDIYLTDTYQDVVRKIDSQTSIVSRIAGYGYGYGIHGLYGDGGMAVDALLSDPTQIAISQNNDIYIADTKNNRVRMVNGSGIISTFAGTRRGFYGDGDNVLGAQFNRLKSIAFTNREELIIADSGM